VIKIKRKIPAGYYMLVIILVCALGLSLSMTFMFNIKEFEIIGSSKYTPAELEEATGVKLRDNLTRLEADEVRTKILSNLIWLEDVKVKKSFPNTLTLQVTESIPTYILTSDYGYYIVSQGNKLLEITPAPNNDLITIKGFNVKNLNTGDIIQSDENLKDTTLEDIYSELTDNNILSEIKYIDLTDVYNIKLNYQNRVEVRLGDFKDLGYKISYANVLLHENIGEDETGALIMQGYNQAIFRTSEELALSDDILPSGDITSQPVTTAVSSLPTSSATTN
jgi:cell division protein FtsQ